MGCISTAGTAGGEDQPPHQRRMADRQLLSDEPAERPAEHIGVTDAQRPEQTGRVVRHFLDGQPVARDVRRGAHAARVEHDDSAPISQRRK